MEPRIPLEDLLLEDNDSTKTHPQIPEQRDQIPDQDADLQFDPPFIPQEQEGDDEIPVHPPPPRRGSRERKVRKPDTDFVESGNLDFRCKGNIKMVRLPKPPIWKQPTDERVPSTNSSIVVTPKSLESDIAKLAREGGVAFMNYLCAKAVPDHDDLPNPENVRDWTYKDIQKMPQHLQKEWQNACLEELEALNKRKVYELCELPPG